jgi:acyl-CoA synthetase (AMP-forming)/AMP-acid ligase II
MSWFGAPAPLLPERLAHHGRWRAARTALVEGERRLSWAELEVDTARIANGLATLGLAPGARVAVLMDNSLEMALLLLGILRSGCVAVPLNVAIADSAVAGMLRDSGARAIFASSRHAGRIDGLADPAPAGLVRVGLGVTRPDWLELRAWMRAASPVLAPRAIHPDDLCNIIYSSGTTGVPKGIVHTHACRLNWAIDLALALRYTSDCVTLCSLGLFSNISWVAMLCTVLVGGTVVVMPHFDASDALELVARERVTHGTFVPLQLERLLALEDVEARDLASLATLMVCGSPLALAVKQAFPKRFGCKLIELYGLTEGLCTILAPEDFAAKAESVGKPFLGTQIKVLGEDDRELAPGETGEIVGIGPLLMAGYYGRDEASREATWTDPAGRRWLRTGDLGRLDADGFLTIVDRKKDMIISGGQNIYPADIEMVMREHPAVLEVAVVGAKSAKWGETPVAFVVADPRAPVDRAELLAWTNERVGRQQRIADVLWRERLPRNANGKILKRELRGELSESAY